METTTLSAPRRPRVRRLLPSALAVLLALGLSGCVSFWDIRRQKHEGSSVVQFLYPDKTPYLQPEIPTLRLPLRVGIAFIPSVHCVESSFTEQQKVELLQKVATQFKSLPFVQGIEIIPTTYLRPGGSFQNLDQLRSMMGIDVIALISYDQAQNTRDTEASLAYWTIVGAYVVPAQRNSTNTLMEAVVYDIASRSLLFRAPGTSSMINNSTLFRAEHEMQKDAAQGIVDASAQLTLNLAQELERFKVRIKEEPQTVRLESKPGFHLGGALDGGFVLLLAGLLGVAHLSRPEMKALHLPLRLFALPGILVALVGNHASGLLLLDHSVRQRGEVWRLWTGHWVHFSASHLGWNLLVLLLAGTGLERARPGWLLPHTLVAAPLVSLALLAVEPAMRAYGGLSALATSVVTLLALARLRDARADWLPWAAVLVLVGGKTAYDVFHPTALFSRFDSPDVRPAVFAHAAGAGVALLLGPWWQRLRPPEMKPPGPVAGARRQGSGCYP